MYPLAPATATRIIDRPSVALPLRILELLPGTRLPVLLALPHAGVAREQAGLLQRRTQGLVEAHQGAGDPVADGPGLPGRAPATHVDQDVELAERVRQLERLGDDHAQRFAREVVLERSPVDDDPALTRPDPDACSRRLAT